MRKYEYKFIVVKMKIGFDFEKKCKELENEWNELGQQGWKFCSWANDSVVFMRELEER